MKKYTRFISLIFIIIGTFTLMMTRLKSLIGNNTVLITGLFFIVLGIILHIYYIKNESKY